MLTPNSKCPIAPYNFVKMQYVPIAFYKDCYIKYINNRTSVPAVLVEYIERHISERIRREWIAELRQAILEQERIDRQIQQAKEQTNVAENRSVDLLRIKERKIQIDE